MTPPPFSLAGKRIGVTGGTGQLGVPLVRTLIARGCIVRVLVRPQSPASGLVGLPVERVQGDVAHGQGLEAFLRDCEGIFHLAALTSTRNAQRQQLWQTNAEATRRLLIAAKHAEIPRILVTSSASVLGFHRDPQQRLSEAHPGELPLGLPYQESKRTVEALALQAASQGLSTVIVQPSLVFGGMDRGEHTARFLELARRGRLQLWPTGGINAVSAYDVVEGMCLTFQHGRSGERYLLGGENLSWRALFARICLLVGGPPPRLPIPAGLLNGAGAAAELLAAATGLALDLSRSRALSLTRYQYLDDSRARAQLGYRPGPLQAGLEDALSNLQQDQALDFKKR